MIGLIFIPQRKNSTEYYRLEEWKREIVASDHGTCSNKVTYDSTDKNISTEVDGDGIARRNHLIMMEAMEVDMAAGIEVHIVITLPFHAYCTSCKKM